MASNHMADAVMDMSRPRAAASEVTGRLSRSLETISAFFLFLFVIAQPLSIAASHVAYAGAALAWVLRLALVRRGMLKSSPLDLPILVFLLLSVVSTLVSPLPASSWEGMRKIALIFLVLVVAHNVPNARRAKQLLAVLFVSSLGAVGWAMWNYVDGASLRIHNPQPGSSFYTVGWREADVIWGVDGDGVERPQDFLRRRCSEPPGMPKQLRVIL